MYSHVYVLTIIMMILLIGSSLGSSEQPQNPIGHPNVPPKQPDAKQPGKQTHSYEYTY